LVQIRGRIEAPLTSDQDPSSREPTTADLFALLWDELVDVLGSSATATLLRRAVKRGVRAQPKLAQLVIHRPAFEYEYVVPEDWTDDAKGRDALAALVQTLVPILEELTGPIVVARLRARPELAHAQIVTADQEEEPS
jgi:hypothetical protein